MFTMLTIKTQQEKRVVTSWQPHHWWRQSSTVLGWRWDYFKYLTLGLSSRWTNLKSLKEEKRGVVISLCVYWASSFDSILPRCGRNIKTTRAGRRNTASLGDSSDTMLPHMIRKIDTSARYSRSNFLCLTATIALKLVTWRCSGILLIC